MNNFPAGNCCLDKGAHQDHVSGDVGGVGFVGEFRRNLHREAQRP